MRKKHTLKPCFRLLPAAIGMLASAGLAQAGNPRCYMHGIITADKAKPVLSDMIRLHFDADDLKKCKELMQGYCELQVVGKHYSPARLQGSFKPDVEKEPDVKIRFDAKCKLIDKDGDALSEL